MYCKKKIFPRIQLFNEYKLNRDKLKKSKNFGDSKYNVSYRKLKLNFFNKRGR